MKTLEQMRQGQDVQVAAPGRRSIRDLLSDPKVAAGMQAVATKHLAPEKMLRLCVNAVIRTPKLALCNPQSVLGAMMTSQALGLEPNTVLQHAFLLPYKRRMPKKDAAGRIETNPQGTWIWEETFEAQYQIGYRGFVTLFARNPRIISVDAEAIHEGDLFEHMKGSDSFLRYQKALVDRGELIGSFCFTAMKDGGEQATVLPLEEIQKIREKSETFKKLVSDVSQATNPKAREKAEGKLSDTPWVMWQDDMAAKSAVKKHAKMVSLGDSTLAAAADLDSKSDTEGVDLSAMVDPGVAQSVVIDGESFPDKEEPVSGETYGAQAVEGKADAVPASKQGAGGEEVWPKRFVDPETKEVGWTDKSGEFYSENLHGWSKEHGMPAMRASGMFRAKRQAPPATKAKPQTAVAPGEEVQVEPGEEVKPGNDWGNME